MQTHLTKSKSRVARGVLAAIRRSHPPSARSNYGHLFGQRVREEIASGARPSGIVATHLYKPPARAHAAERYCAECTKTTRFKEGRCENYGQRVAKCNTCSKQTAHHGNTCIEHTYRRCETCKFDTPHRNGACLYDRDDLRYCGSCQTNTRFHGSVCKEHKLERCVECGYDTPHRHGACKGTLHPKRRSPY